MTSGVSNVHYYQWSSTFNVTASHGVCGHNAKYHKVHQDDVYFRVPQCDATPGDASFSSPLSILQELFHHGSFDLLLPLDQHSAPTPTFPSHGTFLVPIWESTTPVACTSYLHVSNSFQVKRWLTCTFSNLVTCIYQSQCGYGLLYIRDTKWRLGDQVAEHWGPMATNQCFTQLYFNCLICTTLTPLSLTSYIVPINLTVYLMNSTSSSHHSC